MPAFYQWRMNLRPSTEPKMDEDDESAEIEVADEAEVEPCSGTKRASSGTKSKKGKRTPSIHEQMCCKSVNMHKCKHSQVTLEYSTKTKEACSYTVLALSTTIKI